MAIPIIPIIMAVTALASGVTKAVSAVKDSKAQAKVAKAQAEEQVNERARQAVKLMNQQKTSFLKGGVYFDGTPEAVLDETYDFMKSDIDTMKNNANTNIKNIMRQGRTAFASSLMDSVTGALSGYATGAKATGFTGEAGGVMDKIRDVFGRTNN
jgi:hypothetical protein